MQRYMEKEAVFDVFGFFQLTDRRRGNVAINNQERCYM